MYTIRALLSDHGCVVVLCEEWFMLAKGARETEPVRAGAAGQHGVAGRLAGKQHGATLGSRIGRLRGAAEPRGGTGIFPEPKISRVCCY